MTNRLWRALTVICLAVAIVSCATVGLRARYAYADSVGSDGLEAALADSRSDDDR